MPAPSRFYLTTPIYYVTAEPHLGHAYTTILADAICRYQRIRLGDDNVFFLTGTDEHGEKIEEYAKKHGQEPKEFVDHVAALYKHMWHTLEVENDDFIRTTDKRHKDVVTTLWKKMEEAGDIYRAHYDGLYCVACESFYTEKDLLPGNLCPDHKMPVEPVSEEGYFFRLSKYQQPLLDHFAAHPDFIEPAIRMNEVRAFVERGLKDLSASRASVRWGVPVPSDPAHVVYVWLDALTNYYSAMQNPPSRQAFWGTASEPLAIHLIGKEISRFHAVYWPAMLLSAGLPLPKKIVAHGWWTVDGEKMSKTLGNVVDPKVLAADIGAGAVRYFLLREVPLGADGDFSYDALILRYNSELCNDLGNLLNRTLAMVEKYTQGKAQRPGPDNPIHNEPGTVKLRERAEQTRTQVEEAMEALQPARALEALFGLVREGNTYVEKVAYPLTRKGTEAGYGAGHALYQVLEVLRWLGLMLEPFLPERAVEIRRQLGLAEPAESGWPTEFGLLPDGLLVCKGATLFPRIDPDRKQELLAKWRASRKAKLGHLPAQSTAQASAQSTAQAPAQSTAQAPAQSTAQAPAQQPLSTDLITFDDFKRLDLRVARVLQAEKVPKKDRLLKVQLDLGQSQRTVVAGLAEAFRPEDLLGKQVLFLANLKPAKIGGIVSEGMILAVGGEQILGLSTCDREVPPGTPVR